MDQNLYPHSCHILGTLQALHTGMCSGDGWPQDGGLVPSWRPRGCIQGPQPWEDGVRILGSLLGKKRDRGAMWISRVRIKPL